MVWVAITFFVAVAMALLVARRPVAEVQAMVLGGRVGGAGCVVAQAIALLILALAAFLLRGHF